MSTPVPSTTIQLFKGVPLNSDYTDTYLFDDPQQQAQFFSNFEHIDLVKQQYQRKNRGYIRVGLPYEQVYNVNYCLFTNTGHERKTFYCFVDSVDYVNENVSMIHYTLDVMQTYQFDWDLGRCLVIRNHTATDELYEHLEAEGIEPGDYYNYKPSQFVFHDLNTRESEKLSTFSFVIAATMDENHNDSTTSDTFQSTVIQDGLVSGAHLIIKNTAEQCRQWLNDIPAGKEGAVISISPIPRIVAQRAQSGGSIDTPGVFVAPVERDSEFSTALNGYIPQNKKLFSFPYNFMTVYCCDGASRTFRYEYFPSRESEQDEDPMNFRLFASLSLPFTSYVTPSNYLSTRAGLTQYAIYLPPLPTLTWANDTYKAWYAMNSGYIWANMAVAAIDIVGQVAGAVVTGGASAYLSAGMAAVTGANGVSGLPAASYSGMTGGRALSSTQYSPYTITGNDAASIGFDKSKLSTGGLLNDVSTIVQGAISFSNAKKVPDSFNGSASSTTIVASQQYGVYYYRTCCRADYAKIIDDYFTMYGYRVNKIQYPSLANRTRYTFIKTAACDIHGKIPNDDIVMINKIFDNGIRFWKDYDHFLDYDYSTNDPVGGGE